LGGRRCCAATATTGDNNNYNEEEEEEDDDGSEVVGGEGGGGKVKKIRSAVVATIEMREEGRTSQLQRRGGMMLMQIPPRTHTWSCWTNRQLEREEAQRRMRWKMMEEKRSWEEEWIPARTGVMLMGMGMGTGMGIDNADAMMRRQQEEDWMMEEASWQIDTTIPGDDVMAEDGLTFPLLHIGHRTQSSAYSMTHKCFQKMAVGTLQSNDRLEVSFL
jgi:hypothetical protein